MENFGLEKELVYEGDNGVSEQKVYRFEDYGVSVVSAGKEHYEIAIIEFDSKDNNNDYDLCYTSPFTSDVIQGLDKDEVHNYLVVVEDWAKKQSKDEFKYFEWKIGEGLDEKEKAEFLKDREYWGKEAKEKDDRR